MSKPNYKFKTKPYRHQKKIHDTSKDMFYYALFNDQGTGKSKSLIDTAGYLFVNDKIDAVLVAAWPNGVHLNWIDKEFPEHLPDEIPRQMAYWSSSAKAHERRAIQAVLKPSEKRVLKILTINIEAMTTKRGRDLVRQFLRTYRCLWAIDESTCISTHDASRTKACLAMRAMAPYRRILTGTPVLEGPMKAYSQLQFLHEGILGYSNFYAFRGRYAKLVTEEDPRSGREYKVIVAYKNMEELAAKIAKYSCRVLKEDCLDLPPKVFERQYIELSKEQKRAYKSMAEELYVYFSYIEEQGIEITAEMAITKLLRLQQILSGFVKDEAGNVIELEGANPRLKAIGDWSQMIDPGRHKGIIWCKYRYDVTKVAEVLTEVHGPKSVVQYHGGVDKEVRRTNIKKFQTNDEARFFLATKAAAIGLTLTAASYVAFYSHEASLLLRSQAEDRNHRIGQDKSVTYTDFEAVGVPSGVSIDSKILKGYQQKQSLSDLILNDPPKNWLK